MDIPFICSHADKCSVSWDCYHKRPHNFVDACLKKVPDKGSSCKGLCSPLKAKATVKARAKGKKR